MKKLLVTLTVMGIMVGSLATLSSASHKVNDSGVSNIYNGSYYYDRGWASVKVTGANAKASVVLYLHKNGEWKARKQTICKGSKNGLTYFCYSQSIQGKGSDKASIIHVDI